MLFIGQQTKSQMLKNIIRFCVAGICISNINIAAARWIIPEDTRHQINYITRNIYINKDGSSKCIKEAESTIVKEEAKKFWTHFSLEYNKATSIFKVLEAKTIIGNKAYSIDPNKIEDRPIPSNYQSFDQLNQLTLSYPKVELNTKVFLKTEEITNKPIIKDYYSQTWSFGHNAYTKLATIHITSELPLYIEKNDPYNLIEVCQKTKRINNKNLYFIDIKQNKPVIHGIIDEENCILNPKDVTYICVSSLKNWSQFGNILVQDYEKIKKEKLPSLYEEIANLAKKQTNTINKINTVTSLLSEKINYLNDFRTIKGAFIPQHLQAVANSRLGDCKDFSMATSTILQKIGIPSKLALVKRGEINLPLPFKITNFSQFNHVILKVELPDQILWVDPTNKVSMADNIFPDIANKEVLVLDPNNSYLDLIPEVKNQKNSIIINEKWNLNQPKTLEVNGSLKLSGPSALYLTGMQNFYSDESIKNQVVEQISSNYDQILEKRVTLPPLTSRNVEDLAFDYDIKARNSGIQTNAGIAIPLVFNYLNKFKTKKDDVSEVYLGSPGMVDIHSTIENIKPQGTKSLNCDIKSPWVDFIRTVEYKDNQMIVHQKMELKKSWLTRDEQKSPEYQNLQLALDKYVHKGIAIIFEHDSTHG